jgi:hypothetical protein
MPDAAIAALAVSGRETYNISAHNIEDVKQNILDS